MPRVTTSNSAVQTPVMGIIQVIRNDFSASVNFKLKTLELSAEQPLSQCLII